MTLDRKLTVCDTHLGVTFVVGERVPGTVPYYSAVLSVEISRDALVEHGGWVLQLLESLHPAHAVVLSRDPVAAAVAHAACESA